jgi:hypothetical protein
MTLRNFKVEVVPSVDVGWEAVWRNFPLCSQDSTRGLPCQSQLGTSPPHLRNSRQLLDGFQAQWLPVSDMLIRRRQPQSSRPQLSWCVHHSPPSSFVLNFLQTCSCFTFPYLAKHTACITHSLLAKCSLVMVWFSQLNELCWGSY